jgi:hypothetical protein
MWHTFYAEICKPLFIYTKLLFDWNIQFFEIEKGVFEISWPPRLVSSAQLILKFQTPWVFLWRLFMTRSNILPVIFSEAVRDCRTSQHVHTKHYASGLLVVGSQYHNQKLNSVQAHMSVPSVAVKYYHFSFMRDFRLSQRWWVWRLLSSGMLRRVFWYKFTDVSEVHTASIFRVKE